MAKIVKKRRKKRVPKVHEESVIVMELRWSDPSRDGMKHAPGLIRASAEIFVETTKGVHYVAYEEITLEEFE